MKTNETDNWQAIVNKTVESLDFGVIQIVVHNSRVVQIERTQKIRFDLGINSTSQPLRKKAKL